MAFCALRRSKSADELATSRHKVQSLRVGITLHQPGHVTIDRLGASQQSQSSNRRVPRAPGS